MRTVVACRRRWGRESCKDPPGCTKGERLHGDVAANCLVRPSARIIGPVGVVRPMAQPYSVGADACLYSSSEIRVLFADHVLGRDAKMARSRQRRLRTASCCDQVRL